MSFENRGRPKSSEPIPRDNFILTFHEYPTKPELGSTSTFHFDREKSKNGAWKVETTFPKGFKPVKPKIDQRLYNSEMPTVVVFKTSNRSNAKTKIKVINKNIDYVLGSKKTPGIPDTAIWLEVGVGKSFIEKYKLKYKL